MGCRKCKMVDFTHLLSSKEFSCDVKWPIQEACIYLLNTFKSMAKDSQFALQLASYKNQDNSRLSYVAYPRLHSSLHFSPSGNLFSGH